jgi:CRP-like cAMP-binding protein
MDTVNNTFENFRNLNPGDHFGEIGIVYNCPRTASAMTNDYCTFARLPIHNYERLIGEIPEFQTELKRYV